MFLFAHIRLYVFLVCITILILFNVRIKAQFNTLPSTYVRATQQVAKVTDKTCLLTPDYGPCRANVAMYYFDPATMNCSVFQWGGCQGNGNRFDSLVECQTTCLRPPKLKQNRPKYCSLSFDYGFCFGAVYRYYYDRLWKVCKQRIYSGCGGNRNNFYSFEQCESVCRFGTGFLVVEGKDKGKNKKKVLIINPWQHTKTTQRVDFSQGFDPNAPTTCMPQNVVDTSTTPDPDDCF